jgi:hypothetical protein
VISHSVIFGKPSGGLNQGQDFLAEYIFMCIYEQAFHEQGFTRLDCTFQVKDGEEYNTVAAGEDVGVQVTFRNPLQLKLKLTGVQLVCEFQPAAAAPGSGVVGVAAFTAAAAVAPTPPRPEQVRILHVGLCMVLIGLCMALMKEAG